LHKITSIITILPQKTFPNINLGTLLQKIAYSTIKLPILWIKKDDFYVAEDIAQLFMLFIFMSVKT